MLVYRIVKDKKRTKDLSGTGAYNEGGRWNNEGVFALYTSENQALAMLELLVHMDESELPPDLFIMSIEIDGTAQIREIKDAELPAAWRTPGNIILKDLGDKIFNEKKIIAIKARSAVLPDSYNYILNPLFPKYYDLVRVIKVQPLLIDSRFSGHRQKGSQ